MLKEKDSELVWLKKKVFDEETYSQPQRDVSVVLVEFLVVDNVVLRLKRELAMISTQRPPTYHCEGLISVVLEMKKKEGKKRKKRIRKIKKVYGVFFFPFPWAEKTQLTN